MGDILGPRYQKNQRGKQALSTAALQRRTLEEVGGRAEAEGGGRGSTTDLTRTYSRTELFNAPPQRRLPLKSSLLPSQTRGFRDLSRCTSAFLTRGRGTQSGPLSLSISNSFWIIPHPAPIHTFLTRSNPRLVPGSPPLPLRREADQRTHPTRPNCEWEHRRDLQRRRTSVRTFPRFSPASTLTST